jgi:predicted acyl esterase
VAQPALAKAMQEMTSGDTMRAEEVLSTTFESGDYDEVVLRWMDHYLKHINNGVDHEKPVRYFVMGRNQWRDADQWPPTARERRL